MSLVRRVDQALQGHASYRTAREALKTGFVQDERRGSGTVEVWLYDPKSRLGLHGVPPEARYYFTKVDGLTVSTGAPRTQQSGPIR